MRVVSKIKSWFRREPTLQDLSEELYTPMKVAFYLQTLEDITDFQGILGSAIERMNELSDVELELEVHPRA